MHTDQSLYNYLNEQAPKMSDHWHETIVEDDARAVYASKDPKVVKGLKKQNLDFHYLVNHIFNGQEEYFYKEVHKWAISIAEDKEHLKTPIFKVTREFTRVRNIYLREIADYATEHNISHERLDEWRTKLVKAFDFSVNLFIEETYLASERQIQLQRDMINELSTPVIALQNGTALLPLIGEIDTWRAKAIMERTLEQCMEKGVTKLFMDLSGVLVIDTMVAQKLDQLMDALSLIGVKCVLSGIRPEIAQTSVQLGLSFHRAEIASTLSRALSK